MGHPSALARFSAASVALPSAGVSSSTPPVEPSGSGQTSATTDKPTARPSGTLIMISPSMDLLHERTPFGRPNGAQLAKASGAGWGGEALGAWIMPHPRTGCL